MSQSTDDLPQSPNHRRVFVLVVIFICAGLYAVDSFLTNVAEASGVSSSAKQHIAIVKSIIENLIAGAVAAVLFALAYRWIVSWIDPGDRVIELAPGTITDRLLKNAKATRNYVFIGNTASFVSSFVLPILAESARSAEHPKTVRLFLIDPTDQLAIDSYVGYRARVAKGAHRIADSDSAMWFPPSPRKVETADEVKAKVLSAIYISAFVALHPGINVSVYLRRSFTPFRADISDKEAVLTQESAAESAVAFSARGHFYGWYQKEADAQMGQASPLDLTACREVLRGLDLAHPTSPAVDIERALRALLSNFGHLAGLAANAVVIEKAARLVGKPKGAYQ